MALTDKLTAIGDAIREKTGTTELLKLDEMPGVIANISGGGGSKYKPRAISFYDYTGTDLNYELENLDMSELTSIAYTFYRCRKVTEIDLSKHDLSKVTNIKSAFSLCNSLKKLDIRTLDSSIITTYTQAFLSLPSSCVVIVKDEAFREWFTSKFTVTPIIKTVAEYQAEGGVQYAYFEIKR